MYSDVCSTYRTRYASINVEDFYKANLNALQVTI